MPELSSHLYHSSDLDPALANFLNKGTSTSIQPTASENTRSNAEQIDAAQPLDSERENEEITDLFNRITSRPGFAGWDTLSNQNIDGTMALRTELRMAGSAASQYIFNTIRRDESLAQGDVQATHQIYCYCNLLEYCATPQDELQLANLLLDHRIANDYDRSSRTILMGILHRLGSLSSCGPLTEFAHQQSQNTHTSQRTLGLDLHAIQYTLGYIFARSNEEDRLAIRQAQQEIAGLARDHGVEAEQVSISRFNAEQEQEYYEHLFRDRFNNGSSSFNSNYDPSYNSDSPENENSSYWDRDDETVNDPQRELDEDEEIENEVEQRLGYEISDRLDVLRNLHKIPDTEVIIPGLVETDPEKLIQKHNLELKENNPSPYAPTLGIEIEIRDKVVLSPEVMSLDYDDKRRYKEEIREQKYMPTTKAGIPAGADAFWEFAHSPAHHPLTLSREVQWLIRHGLIPPERGKHSLHLTIGGITSTENAADYDDENNAQKPSQAFLLGRALEATGWCTTRGRILQPVLSNSYGWAYRGNSGVNERHSVELKLNQDKAVEYRIFQLQTLSGLNRMLGSAYALGAALKAYQECEVYDKKETFIMPPDNTQRRLAKTWQDFSDHIKQLFESYTLANPEKVWPIPETKDSNPYLDELDGYGGFNLLATLLNESVKEPDSDGAQFVSAARKLVIQARAKVEQILTPLTANSTADQSDMLPSQLAAD